MKNNHLTITTLAFALAGMTAYAEWNIAYDFNDGVVPEEISTQVNLETSAGFSDIMNGMLRVNHGAAQELTSNTLVMLPLGTDLVAASAAVNGPVTVYFEMVHPLVNGSKAIVDVAWGLSNIDPDVVLETRYNSFNAMMRINAGTNGYELRDGGSYTPVDQLTADEKYSVWMVVDYTLNFMEVYIQGGQYTTQTNLGAVAFRINPDLTIGQTVDYMLIALSDGTIEAPKGVDYFLFDNIALDTSGQNLTMPATGSTPKWGPWDLVGADANTGSWLGWVNTTYDPYIWVYSLGKYVYVDINSVGGNGGWVYVPNYN